MNENNDIQIELKSEPMNDMLAHPPSWIVQSGNGLFLLILLILLGLAWFIRYPDEITGTVVVSTSEPPIELTNQLYVQLRSLSVSEGKHVQKNEILAQFDHKAKQNEIIRAENYLKTIAALHLTSSPTLPEVPDLKHLGTFQEPWTVLVSKITEWNELQASGIEKEQLHSLQREIQYREQLQHISHQKINLSEAEYALISEELKTSGRLIDQNAISRQTFNQEKRTENQAMLSVQNQKEQAVQNLIQLNLLKKELLQLTVDQKQKMQQRISGIQSAVSALENQLTEWQKNAVWQAPCSGKVMFNTRLQINRFYAANKASIVIVPDGNQLQALASIQASGAGKVKKGQRVFIELSDYPKNEFGMIEGRIVHMTQIDKEGQYEVRIHLPNRLTTTYHKNIPMKAQLKGSVKIITTNKRLLERFFEKLTNLL